MRHRPYIQTKIENIRRNSRKSINRLAIRIYLPRYSQPIYQQIKRTHKCERNTIQTEIQKKR